MKTASMIAAALLGAAIFTAGTMPGAAQTARARTAVRANIGVRTGAGARILNTTQAPFGMFPMQIQRLPEQGTLREFIGTDRVSNVNGPLVTLRASSGAMAAIRVPAARIRAMGLRPGSIVLFRMLNSQLFQITTIIRSRPAQ